MKQILLMIAVVALVGCGKDKPQERELTPEFNTENIVQGANAPPLPASESVQMEAAEAKAATAKTNAAPDIPLATDKVGQIANVDPKYGFIIINRGSAHGFKVGDKFNVFRKNKLIGRIEVIRLSQNPSLSVAKRSEGLGVPAGAQFQVNDDLVRFK